MPQVSRYKLSKKHEQLLIDSMHVVLSSISKKEEMMGFLDAFLTDTEKLMLAKRLAIVVLLTEKHSDTEIANALHVTRMTVAKMRYFLDVRGTGYGIALEKITQEKRLQSYKRLLVSLVSYSIRAAGGYVKHTTLIK